MKKKVIVYKLQNEKAAKEYDGIIEVGKEYELPVNGKCVIYSNCYQLVGNDDRILYGTGFPIGYAHDTDNNEYSVFLERRGIVLYLQIHDR